MPVFERAHAFQAAKSALEALPIDKRQLLDALGAQLNCSAIVDGLVHDWRYLFDSTWFDFTQLTIVSFHNSAGTQINNTTIAGNATILLPVIDGAVANCRQADVRFVRVTSNVDFSSLVRLPNYGPAVLRVGFYIELPQTTVRMTNGNGVAYQLTTWHGAADLSTLNGDDVRTLILAPCLQDGPILLRPADFNLGQVNIKIDDHPRNYREQDSVARVPPDLLLDLHATVPGVQRPAVRRPRAYSPDDDGRGWSTGYGGRHRVLPADAQRGATILP